MVAHRACVLGRKAQYLRAAGGLQRHGPGAPVRAVDRGDRLEDGKPFQGAARPSSPSGKFGRGRPLRSNHGPEQGCKGLALQPLVCFVVKKAAGLSSLQVGRTLLQQSADFGATLESGHRIGGDVARLQSGAAGRGVGADFVAGRSVGVDRVDADEVGAQARHLLGRFRQIAVVADSQVTLRAQAVEGGRDAPGPAAPPQGRRPPTPVPARRSRGRSRPRPSGGEDRPAA